MPTNPPPAPPRRGGSASGPRTVLVLGAGLAGLLAAAALAPYADDVLVVERDAPDPASVPDPARAPAPAGGTRAARRGLPQARHAHMLWSGGADAIEALLPGTTAAWLGAGANRVPVPAAMVALSPGGWYRLWPESHYLIAASRPLIDAGVRSRLLAAHPNVRFLYGAQPTALVGCASRVHGARIRCADGTHTEVPACVVVDATGRGSRASHWLAALGLPPVACETIDPGVAYATRRYRAPAPTKDWPVVTVQADARLGGPGRFGTVLPVENDEWLVSVCGSRGGNPTSRNEDFEPFARGLRSPLVADLIARAEPLSDVVLTRSTANRRFRYEKMRLPAGFLVLGDAACALNPVYGHGLSVAAQGALAVRDTAAKAAGRIGSPGFTRRAQRALARPAAAAWLLASGGDLHFPGCTGKSPTALDDLAQRYINRLIHTATGNHTATTALTEVMTLRSGAGTLLGPRVVWAAVTGPGQPRLSGPPLPPAVAEVLSRDPLPEIRHR
ncbi:pyridine nucleotide-disulfide oxidoreductase [Streptomyces sp. NPDC046876]|uniref:pyridine nucleotide-disulfide oxidoreductase n=1 Tax=Streptomyces sp. NPDC046876 TaxID=3155616 RepID=UPI0033C95814